MQSVHTVNEHAEAWNVKQVSSAAGVDKRWVWHFYLPIRKWQLFSHIFLSAFPNLCLLETTSILKKLAFIFSVKLYNVPMLMDSENISE